MRLCYANYVVSSFVFGLRTCLLDTRVKVPIAKLGHLQHLRWRELSLEYTVPKSACHTKTILVVREMVLEVVLLQFAPV
jgi:hypothetical protein